MPRRTFPAPRRLRLPIALALLALPLVAGLVDGGTISERRIRGRTIEELRRVGVLRGGEQPYLRNVFLSETHISPRPCTETGCSAIGIPATLINFTVVGIESLIVDVTLDTADWTMHMPNRGTIAGYDLRPPGHNQIPFDGVIRGGATSEVRVDGTYGIIIKAFPDTGLAQSDTLILVIDRVRPVVQSVTTMGGVSTYRNNETIVIEMRADQPGYTVVPDFRAIDTDPAQPTEVFDKGGGLYEIRHTISDDNSKIDASGLVIPIRVTDLAGNFINHAALRLCLSNQPPMLLSARTLNAPEGAYRNESLIQIETTWQSSDTALTVRADFKGLDTAYDSTRYVTSRLTGNRYHSSYRLSDANQKPDGSYLVPIVASDHGCGVSPMVFVTIELDTEAGMVPVFDAVPAGVREAVYTLRGTAMGSNRVLILQNEALVDTFQVDMDGRFEVPVTLVTGNNRFTAEGIDVAGNRTVRSVPALIIYLTDGFVTIPIPFRPGNAFQVGADQPSRGVRIELWTLGGDLARVLVDDSTADVYSITWDGRDEAGERVNSGPLIVLIRTDFTDGSSVTEKRALVLTAGTTP